MQHPGKAWYEESEIYEELQRTLPALSKLGKRWEFALALRSIERNDGPVFDIGCGRGDFLKLAGSRGLSVSGIDLNRSLVNVAQKTYRLPDVECASAEDYSKKNPGHTFGTITAFELLEHLPDPRTFIRECHRLLRPKGKLIISVPGYQRWPKWVNSETDLPPHHLILWSEQALRRLLESNGFSSVRTFRKPFLLDDLMYHAVRWVPGLQSARKPVRYLRGGLKISLIPIWMGINFHPQAGGFTILAVAEK